MLRATAVMDDVNLNLAVIILQRLISRTSYVFRFDCTAHESQQFYVC